LGAQYTFHGLRCVRVGGGDLLMGHEHLLILLLRRRRATGGEVRYDKLMNPRDGDRGAPLRSVGRWLAGLEAMEECGRVEGEIGKRQERGLVDDARTPTVGAGVTI
jgi:hypothetical protein